MTDTAHLGFAPETAPLTMMDLAAGRRPFALQWALAACFAVLAHAALAYAFVTRAETEDTDVAMGSPAIEIGIEMTAPKSETSDLPPGVLADESAASPEMPEQQAKVQETTLPKDKPTDTDDPDRLVSENPVEKPDETPKPEVVQSRASAASVASEAAAPPPSEKAREAVRSAAPVQGIGDSEKRVISTWQKQLVAYLDHHKRYPSGNKRQVTIVVEFTIDRVGHVQSARVAQSSGSSAFDDAAVAMVHRSDPVPAPPALIADEGLTFTVPVIFREKRP